MTVLLDPEVANLPPDAGGVRDSLLFDPGEQVEPLLVLDGEGGVFLLENLLHDPIDQVAVGVVDHACEAVHPGLDVGAQRGGVRQDQVGRHDGVPVRDRRLRRAVEPLAQPLMKVDWAQVLDGTHFDSSGWGVGGSFTAPAVDGTEGTGGGDSWLSQSGAGSTGWS